MNRFVVSEIRLDAFVAEVSGLYQIGQHTANGDTISV